MKSLSKYISENKSAFINVLGSSLAIFMPLFIYEGEKAIQKIKSKIMNKRYAYDNITVDNLLSLHKKLRARYANDGKYDSSDMLLDNIYNNVSWKNNQEVFDQSVDIIEKLSTLELTPEEKDCLNNIIDRMIEGINSSRNSKKNISIYKDDNIYKLNAIKANLLS